MSTQRKLSRTQQKEIKTAIARANRTDKKELSAQDSIPYLQIRVDGICQVTPTHFTKTIQFWDINYQLSDNEDKQAMPCKRKQRWNTPPATPFPGGVKSRPSSASMLPRKPGAVPWRAVLGLQRKLPKSRNRRQPSWRGIEKGLPPSSVSC